MGIVRQSAIIQYSSDGLNTLFDFFEENIQSELLRIDRENHDLIFDEKATLHYYLDSDYYLFRMVYTFNETRIEGVGNYARAQYRVYSDDNLVILSGASASSDKPQLIAEKIGDRFFAYFENRDSFTLNITNRYMTEYNSTNTFAHKQRLNYSGDIGFIDYTDEALFNSANVKTIIDPNCIACSTVTPDQIITMNGKNYYSIGTNTLVLLDEE